MASATATKEHLTRWAAEVFRQAVEVDMVAALREAAPLGQTGETRRGIEAIAGGALLRPAAVVRSKAPGGDYVEEGTQPHVILPRSGSALRFLGGSGRVSTAGPNQRIATRAGGVVFAKRVNHPGTPARPWFRPVVERFGEFLERAAARVR